MPLYEYKCTKCNGYFEKLQKFSDPTPTQCELCKETGGIERLLSTPAFHLKGGGWYKDGYASSAPAAASKPETSTSSDAKPSAPAKTESKPAASTPASTGSAT